MDDKLLEKLVADVAKRELREDESTRTQALDQFRDWIEKNSDIRDCRTDDVFLLRFLRNAKFSIPIAQQIFLRYVTFCQTYPHFMQNNDMTDPKMNPYLRNGYTYKVPLQNEHGCRVLIIRYCRFDPYNSSFTDHVSAAMTSTMTLMEDEAAQVLGVVAVFDLTGCTAAHLTHMPIPELVACMKAMQRTIPLRYKGVHFINLSPLFKWLMDLIISQLSAKMAQRFMSHCTLEDFYKHIDRKILPKEYGGDMPEQEMIDLWYKELESKREMVILSNKLHLVQLDDANLKTNMAALPGSFRKLDMD